MTIKNIAFTFKKNLRQPFAMIITDYTIPSAEFPDSKTFHWGNYCKKCDWFIYHGLLEIIFIHRVTNSETNTFLFQTLNFSGA